MPNSLINKKNKHRETISRCSHVLAAELLEITAVRDHLANTVLRDHSPCGRIHHQN